MALAPVPGTLAAQPAPPPPSITPFPPESPEWWLTRLLQQLEGRAPSMRIWDDYYEGKQPLAFASDKFREAFGSRFPAFTSNFCSLVVEGMADRLEVQGFRFSDPQGDEDVWEIWQANDMDAGSQQAHLEALIKGTAYALVEPNGEDIPRITVEDPLDAILDCDPRDARNRRAGLKRWLEDDGRLVCVVYLPDGIYKYRTKARWEGDLQRWWLQPGHSADTYMHERLWIAAGFEPYQPTGDATWPLRNPLGVVPLIALPNRPRLKLYGQSEVAVVRSNQDAVNKYRTDALIASEFAAFPQRYLLNFEPETDESTGRAKEPFRAAIDRLWVVPPPDPDIEGAPEPKFGQFDAANLEPYQHMIALEVGHMAAISRLPYHYLLGTPQTVPPSGESLKASEAGLEHKIARTEVFLGHGYEELMRVCLRARSDERASQRDAETIWHDSETRNEAVRTDSIVKLHAEGIIDDELAWELGGLSPQQVRRLQDRRKAAAEAEAKAASEAAAAPAAETPGAPATVVPAPTGTRMGSGAVVPSASQG